MEQLILKESQYLEGLKEELRKAADKLLETLEYYSGTYREQARYVWESQDVFDNYEAIFNLLSMDRTVDAQEKTRQQLSRIIRLLDSPYFARIDFREEGQEELMKIYIGKFAFWDMKSGYEIYDWRAPVSSMYYEFEEGDACYETPEGRVDGRILGKKQYGIRKGVLEYVLESSVSISDEVLQRELAGNSDYRMKDIVATIQKEQNRLIRNETADVLIIQGVAGSGKTSIALHRVAYFLYRYRNEIKTENFLILSPNGIFVDYISNVLPELGEESVRNIGMEDIAAQYLPEGIKAERLCYQTEKFQAGGDRGWMERNEYKASPEFARQLEEYLKGCDKNCFTAEDYEYENGVLEAEFIRRNYSRRLPLPVRMRLQELAGVMAEEIRIQRKGRGMRTRRTEIFEWLTEKFLYNDPLELYGQFYRDMGREELFVWEEGKELESGDIFPLIYVKLYLEGGAGNGKIKYLIVDEMQDYTPVQYAVLNKLYPCKKTILGDFAQNVVPFAQSSMAYLKELYPAAQVIEIHKSYRSTWEIMNFAGRVRKDVFVEPVRRHGEQPAVILCEGEEEEREKVLELVRTALDRKDCIKLGVICKSYVQAEEWYLWLEGRLGMQEKLHLLTYDSEEFYDGVMVTAVSMSKGLEFDEVVIPGADAGNYASEYDRGLLYVACTRAMHRLTLLYSGKPGPWLEEEEGSSEEAQSGSEEAQSSSGEAQSSSEAAQSSSGEEKETPCTTVK